MGKLFQLVVPNYPAKGEKSSPLTYLRLGAAFAEHGEDLDAEERGDSHLEEFEFESETTHRDLTGLDTTRYGAHSFRDDASSLPHAVPDEELTAELLTRGGIREHTDGNRISTTRGDCVEVVGGNYKLIVMGRVDGPHVNTASWESSGGILHDANTTPGAAETVSVRWSQTDGGTWEVTEETERGEVHFTVTGRSEEVFTGPSRIGYIGYGGPKHTPSKARRPRITTTTYARQIAAETHVGTLSETTHIQGNYTQATATTSAVAPVYEWTDATGSGTTITECEGTPSNPIGDYTDRTYAGMTFAYEQFGTKTESSAGSWTNTVKLGLEAEVGVGTKLGLHYDQIPIAFGLSAMFETKMAAALEVKVGASVAIKLGSFASVHAHDEKEWSLVEVVEHLLYHHKIAALEYELQELEWLQSFNNIQT
ncbi:MAG: hypothetical protein FJ095_12555 [Deltaproteobacteria bacterium]|nr:hypothetical protein [Deltaproteobacteria bacterium]